MRTLSKVSIASLVVGVMVAAGGCKKDAEAVPAPADQATAATEPVAAPEPAPVDAATKYDGKIVHQPDAGRGKDDGWFLVKDGKRRWITETTWLEANGYKATDVIYITSEEFNAIPEDPRPLPETEPAAAPSSADATSPPETH
jgi:hypothetical protein